MLKHPLLVGTFLGAVALLGGCDRLHDYVNDHWDDQIDDDRPEPPPTMDCVCGPERPAIACAHGEGRWDCVPADHGQCAWQLSCDEDPAVSCENLDEATCVRTPGCVFVAVGAPCGPDGCIGPAGACQPADPQVEPQPGPTSGGGVSSGPGAVR